MIQKRRWFLLTPPYSEEYKHIRIKARLFFDKKDFESYLTKMLGKKRETGDACCISYGDKNKRLTDIELCFDGNNLSWYIITHELGHAAFAFCRACLPPTEETNDFEEWVCTIYSHFFYVFKQKFEKRFRLGG